MTSTPPAEWPIDAVLVRVLLADQHPDLAELSLEAVDAGWDNALFRLGPDLAVRLPRRTAAVELLRAELRWLPQLAPTLGIPVPVPVRSGLPGRGFPSPWSVARWVPGEPADTHRPQPESAALLGTFLRALHRPGPSDGPRNPFRGCPLAHRAETVEGRLARLTPVLGTPGSALGRLWSRALSAPAADTSVWIHGDLHPRNVLTVGGRFSGVVDWGDLGVGDPATDLAALWMLFSPEEVSMALQAFQTAYGLLPRAVLDRTLGWAVSFGLMFLETGLADHPRHAVIGRRTLETLARYAEEAELL